MACSDRWFHCTRPRPHRCQFAASLGVRTLALTHWGGSASVNVIPHDPQAAVPGGGSRRWADLVADRSRRRSRSRGLTMRSVRLAINAFLGLTWSLTCGALAFAEPQAAPEEGQRPTLRAGSLPGDFALDGRISEPAWSAADSISNLVTIEPREG